MSTTQLLPLLALVCDDEYQPRTGGLDKDNLERLAASDPTHWPALLVSPLGAGRYVIIDGYHRYEVAQRLKLDTLDCQIADNAGYPEAAEANLRHGLPLSVQDRKDYARYVHEQEPRLSYRELGRRCGLSDKTVKAALRDDADNPQSGRKFAPNVAARLVRQLLDVRDDAANAWGIRTHGARVEAFGDALAKQDNPKKAAQRLADTCRAALEAAEGVARAARK